MTKIAQRDKFKLGNSQVQQKLNSKEFINAVEKIQKHLQREVNTEFGKNAPTISYAYATQYIYDNYLKGQTIK